LLAAWDVQDEHRQDDDARVEEKRNREETPQPAVPATPIHRAASERVPNARCGLCSGGNHFRRERKRTMPIQSQRQRNGARVWVGEVGPPAGTILSRAPSSRVRRTSASSHAVPDLLPLLPLWEMRAWMIWRMLTRPATD